MNITIAALFLVLAAGEASRIRPNALEKNWLGVVWVAVLSFILMRVALLVLMGKI